MTQRIAVIGAPGTGKTRALTNLFKYLTTNKADWVKYKFIDEYDLRDVFDKTYDKNEMVFITFTTSAAKELRERGVMNAYTMHSYVTRVLNFNTQLAQYSLDSGTFIHVMLEQGYGWDFRTTASRHPSNVAAQKYVYYWNVYYDKTDEEILDIVAARENNEVYKRIEAYVKYIRENNILDYVQILRVFLDADIETLKTHKRDAEKKVLILDEAQDFSPLQWAVVEKLLGVGSFDYVIAAGDSNQSIYRFQGAVEKLFENFIDTADHVVVLKKSWRVPARVYNLAEGFVKLFGRKWEFESRDEEGVAEVKYFNKSAFQKDFAGVLMHIEEVLEKVDEKDRVFILTRTNDYAEKLERALIERGYVTKKLKNTDSIYDVFAAVQAWEEDNVLSTTLLEALAYNDAEFRELLREVKNKYNLRTLDVIMELARYVDEGKLQFMHVDEADALYEYVGKNYMNALSEKDRLIYERMQKSNGRTVFVDTMHAAKGLEADVVIVLDYINNKIEKELKTDVEALKEEGRLLYVAMTRAKRELYLFTTKSNRSIYRRIYSTLF